MEMKAYVCEMKIKCDISKFYEGNTVKFDVEYNGKQYVFNLVVRDCKDGIYVQCLVTRIFYEDFFQEVA